MCDGRAQRKLVSDGNTSKEPDMTPRIRLRRMIARVRRGLSDMSYAQRRVFENQTGVAVVNRSRAIARTGAELEALYAHDGGSERQSAERSRERPTASATRRP
jgi:hypothetical protein